MPISLVGRVTKAGFMNKTVTVSVDRMVQHERTHKLIKRTSKLLTHDEKNVLRTEDLVRIRSCPRKSRRKHFETDIVISRGYEGRQFDLQNPRKAAPVLTSLAEIEALKSAYSEVRQALQENDSQPLTEGKSVLTSVEPLVKGATAQGSSGASADQR